MVVFLQFKRVDRDRQRRLTVHRIFDLTKCSTDRLCSSMNNLRARTTEYAHQDGAGLGGRGNGCQLMYSHMASARRLLPYEISRAYRGRRKRLIFCEVRRGAAQ